MKQEFNTVWKASSQTRKQRKYRYNAPYHTKRSFLAVHLNAELKQKYSRRSVKVRVGDKATVLRGQFRKKSGKVERVDLGDQKVFITGIETVRKEGAKELYPFEPSNLMLTELNLDDKMRLKSIQKEKGKSITKAAPAKKQPIQEEKKNEPAEVKNG